MAQNSCSLLIDMSDLKLTPVEQAQIELALKQKNFNQGQGTNLYQNYDRYFYMEKIQVTDKIDRKGNPIFKISHRVEKKNAQNPAAIDVSFEDEEQSASDVRIVLRKGMGEIVKVMKPKKKLFVLKDEGSPGYKLLRGLIRDLPKCKEDKNVAVNDGDRDSGKDVPNSSISNFGFSTGSSVFGM